MQARAEFTIEPFVDGQPGPHVDAAIAAVRTLGLEPEIGPFGTAVSGEESVVTDAVAALLVAARKAGARRVSVHVVFDE